jgi:hypothetical protein
MESYLLDFSVKIEYLDKEDIIDWMVKLFTVCGWIIFWLKNIIDEIISKPIKMWLIN